MCVHELRQTINKLTPEGLLKLGIRHLNKTCDVTNKACTEEKNLMIDVIAHVQSNTSQQLMIQFILALPALKEEEVQRCLLHCIAIKSPTTVGCLISIDSTYLHRIININIIETQ